MGSVSAANAVLMLSIGTLFPTPQPVQGFAPESMIGVDGLKSDGFVFALIPQTITLQADSASNALFDIWWTQMQAAQDVYLASGVIRLPSVAMKYGMTDGSLTGYKPIASAKKLLQPRTYEITWGRFNPAPTG
jgi:hypothetical protein